MERNAVRRAWDRVGDAYGDFRNADGPETVLFTEFAEPLGSGSRILDVGCGDGRRTAAHLVDEFEVLGLDFSRGQLDRLRESVPAARPVQADMTRLPLADDSVDGIVAYYSVFHVPRTQHQTVYDEFARVCRPGGRLILTVSRQAHEGTRRGWLRPDVEMFWSTPGREATMAELDEAGFDTVWARDVVDGLGETVHVALCERRVAE
ncbi:class I SAM-dependent methyltransferase [Haloarchaeobius sp. DT45]|uniref:class I SAM-dependent methyltransferase n=1 Tax=Haloarchaeobius sp. DT45 TaxID=3446116 RepID=UPI003F6CAEDB